MNAPLLKASDVMEALSISRRLVYQMAQDGRLPCVRVGGPDGPLRFKPDDLERLLDEWERR
jgi:excisionase family DNA binding protein